MRKLDLPTFKRRIDVPELTPPSSTSLLGLRSSVSAAPLVVDRFDIAPRASAMITEARSKVALSRLNASHELMRTQNAENMRELSAVAPENREYVTTLSLNFGQLDFARVVGVKGVTERQDLFATAFADVLLYGADTGSMAPRPPDIVQCQELWLSKARLRLNEVAARCGFEPMLDDKKAGTYGMQIYARSAALADVHDRGIIEFLGSKKGQHEDELPMGKPMRAGFDRVARIRRGYAYVQLEMKSGLKVLASTTHLSPLHNYAWLRDSQFNAMARIHQTLSEKADVAMLGTDLNTTDTVRAAGGPQADHEIEGIGSLTRFHQATGTIDAYVVAGRPDDHSTMSDDLKQFTNEWDMSGQRIDYQLLSVRPSAVAACVSYGTVLGETHLTSRNRLMPISDHKGVQATYCVARRDPQ